MMRATLMCVALSLVVLPLAQGILILQRITFNCQTMLPDPETILGQPEPFPSPFKIVIDRADTYEPSDELYVNLIATSGRRFGTFFIQARQWDEYNNSDKPIGYWGPAQENITEHNCESTSAERNGGAVVNVPSKVFPTNFVRLRWTVPDISEWNVQFHATFVDEDSARFWLERSEVIKVSGTTLHGNIPLSSDVLRFKPKFPNNDEPNEESLMPQPMWPISTAKCGEEKGCFREPGGCWEHYCEYIVTWRHNGEQVDFEIGTRFEDHEDHWAAIGLSNDIKMGSDSVMECVFDSSTGKVDVFLSYNERRHNERLYGSEAYITFQQGSYDNGRLQSRFSRRIVPGIRQRAGRQMSLLSNDWHILVAKGYAYQGSILPHSTGVAAYPIVSTQKVSLQSKGDISGLIKYPLVKAHACLMVFAFMFCGTNGLMVAIYYKSMWHNKRFCGSRYWLVAYRGLMTLLSITVLTAFVLTFVADGGDLQGHDFARKAHAIMGVIIVACVIVNPILAFLRPSSSSEWRLFFSFFHWAFGIVPNILAIPNMFIGMEFGKVNVPSWAGWILIFYILFHLMIGVCLEIHESCIEQRKKGKLCKLRHCKTENNTVSVSKPEPVGHLFKTKMLFVHVVVTTIAVFVTIMIVAMC